MSISIRASDTVVILLGESGTGKSTFVNAAAGKHVATIGHSLNSCTQNIQPFIVPSHHGRIVLVDTPGFNDVYDADQRIWRDVVAWLERSCQPGAKFAGFIFLHDISNPRSRSTSKLFSMLYSITTKNVVLATTRWSDVEAEMAVMRERELSRHWSELHMARFDGTPESAWDIVNSIIQKNPANVIAIAQELVKYVDHSTKQSKRKKSGFIGLFMFLFK